MYFSSQWISSHMSTTSCTSHVTRGAQKPAPRCAQRASGQGLVEYNAFKVAQDVSMRIDGSAAPSGYMRSFVTAESDSLFYWDKTYLMQYIEATKRSNKIVPGHNYYSKLDKFSKQHVVFGHKYMEFLKFSCAKKNEIEACSHCEIGGWVGAPWHRVLEPMPDYTISDNFKYLDYNDTPSYIDNILHHPDDFNPKLQLKQHFAQNIVKQGDSESIASFSKKFIVDEDIVRTALDDLVFKKISIEIRQKDNQRKRAAEEELTFDDINWLEAIEDGSIKKCLLKL